MIENIRIGGGMLQTNPALLERVLSGGGGGAEVCDMLLNILQAFNEIAATTSITSKIGSNGSKACTGADIERNRSHVAFIAAVNAISCHAYHTELFFSASVVLQWIMERKHTPSFITRHHLNAIWTAVGDFIIYNASNVLPSLGSSRSSGEDVHEIGAQLGARQVNSALQVAMLVAGWEDDKGNAVGARECFVVTASLVRVLSRLLRGAVLLSIREKTCALLLCLVAQSRATGIAKSLKPLINDLTAAMALFCSSRCVGTWAAKAADALYMSCSEMSLEEEQFIRPQSATTLRSTMYGAGGPQNRGEFHRPSSAEQQQSRPPFFSSVSEGDLAFNILDRRRRYGQSHSRQRHMEAQQRDSQLSFRPNINSTGDCNPYAASRGAEKGLRKQCHSGQSVATKKVAGNVGRVADGRPGVAGALKEKHRRRLPTRRKKKVVNASRSAISNGSNGHDTLGGVRTQGQDAKASDTSRCPLKEHRGQGMSSSLNSPSYRFARCPPDEGMTLFQTALNLFSPIIGDSASETEHDMLSYSERLMKMIEAVEVRVPVCPCSPNPKISSDPQLKATTKSGLCTQNRDSAAIRVQRLVRSYLASQRRTNAAIKIQAFTRRHRVKLMRYQMEDFLSEGAEGEKPGLSRDGAVLAIQHWWKMRVAGHTTGGAISNWHYDCECDSSTSLNSLREHSARESLSSIDSDEEEREAAVIHENVVMIDGQFVAINEETGEVYRHQFAEGCKEGEIEGACDDACTWERRESSIMSIIEEGEEEDDVQGDEHSFSNVSEISCAAQWQERASNSVLPSLMATG
jgi:hypothetical protein